jgi:hypothetical protein
MRESRLRCLGRCDTTPAVSNPNCCLNSHVDERTYLLFLADRYPEPRWRSRLVGEFRNELDIKTTGLAFVSLSTQLTGVWPPPASGEMELASVRSNSTECLSKSLKTSSMHWSRFLCQQQHDHCESTPYVLIKRTWKNVTTKLHLWLLFTDIQPRF